MILDEEMIPLRIRELDDEIFGFEGEENLKNYPLRTKPYSTELMNSPTTYKIQPYRKITMTIIYTYVTH